MGLGSNVKRLREARGISQEKLAPLAGISANNLARIEQGKVRDPKQSTLRGLAQALKVSLDELAAEGDPSPEPEAVREAVAQYAKSTDDDERALCDFLARGTHAPVSAAEVTRLREWSTRSHRMGALMINDYADALDLLRVGRRQ